MRLNAIFYLLNTQAPLFISRPFVVMLLFYSVVRFVSRRRDVYFLRRTYFRFAGIYAQDLILLLTNFHLCYKHNHNNHLNGF